MFKGIKKQKIMDCYFCKRNIRDIDWQEVSTLKIFITGLGKIRKRKDTGLCAKHQRKVARAIKRARHFGILSYTSK